MPRSKTVVSPAAPGAKEGPQGREGRLQWPQQAVQTALQTQQRAGQFAYEHRRLKKRDFRTLWIVRINAAAAPRA